MPEDMEMTLRCPGDKLEYFVSRFLASRPIPIDEAPESETYGQPLYTIKEHIKREIIRLVNQKILKHGDNILSALEETLK